MSLSIPNPSYLSAAFAVCVPESKLPITAGDLLASDLVPRQFGGSPEIVFSRFSWLDLRKSLETFLLGSDLSP